MTDKKPLRIEPYQIMELPTANLEKMYIEAYLRSKGLSLAALRKLPASEIKQIMKEASTYASSKLAEVEKRAEFVRDLHGEE